MAALLRRATGAASNGGAEPPATAAPVPDTAPETLAQDMAALLRRGLGAGGGSESPDSDAASSASIPSEVASSEPGSLAAPLSPAVLAYRKGDVAALMALAETAAEPDERLALTWAALRVDPRPGFGALEAFAKAHPTWPGLRYVRYRQESDILVHPPSPAEAAAFFAAEPPQSSAGKLALAQAMAATGRVDEAIGIVRALWRDGNFDTWTESAILRDFAPVLLKSDHKYRADRLLYAESYAAALRAAQLAGPDEMALAQARYAAARGPLSAELVKAVPAALRNDPGLRVRPHPGRPAIEPRLRSGEAAQPRAEGPRCADRSRQMVVRAPYGRPRVARPQRTEARLRALRQGRRPGRFRQPGRPRIPRRLDCAALSRRRARGGQALRPRRRGRRDAAFDRPRRLLARPGGGGARRRGERQASL